MIRPRRRSVSTGPNIVFVLTDDVSVNLMQYMPHVAAMEQEGTTFENHFVVDSLCCPSRTSIFTGEYPHDDGVFTNGGADGGYPAFNRNGDAINSFAPALQHAGYRTALLGKYLNEYLPGDPPALGWDEWDVGGYAYPEFNYDLNENGKVQHYGSAPSDYLTNVLSQKATHFVSTSARQSPTRAPRATRSPCSRRSGPPVHARRSCSGEVPSAAPEATRWRSRRSAPGATRARSWRRTSATTPSTA